MHLFVTHGFVWFRLSTCSEAAILTLTYRTAEAAVAKARL